MLKIRIKYMNKEDSTELISLIKKKYDVLEEQELPDFRSRSKYTNNYLIVEKKKTNQLKND